MRVRRAVTVTGAVAALVLLGAPAWADETPSPSATEVVVDGSGTEVPPADDPSCSFVAVGSAEPSAEATDVSAEPTDDATVDPTDEPTVDPTDEATVDPTDEPTVDPTDEPTVDPTDEPTVDPTDAPTGTPDPTGYWVCASAGQAGGEGSQEPTLGSGTAQLPFSGAPVGRYAATGLALVLAGGGTVLLARRRST